MKKLLVLLACFSCFWVYGSDTLSIKMNDGINLVGRLSLPEGGGHVPVIVIFVPGTGPNTYLNKRKFGNTEFNYYDLFETEFNKRGIGFFTYNRRGVELGDQPPYFDKVDSVKYAKYAPKREVLDVETMISALKEKERLKKAKVVLLGASEGTIIVAMIAERMVEEVSGLLLFGYANDNMADIIKWQFSGVTSIMNLQKYFDTNKDKAISRQEYEATDTIATLGRVRVLKNTPFDVLNAVKDSVLDYQDFAARNKPFYEYLLQMTAQGNDEWIWKNYFRVTSYWLKEHFKLEPNKTRLLNIDIPIYIFQGVEDANAPVEGVYDIQSRFKQANKTNLKCFIFEGHNHDLNYLDWPFKHQISEGLNTLFNTSSFFIQ
jgi:pimeloyl-ACP methyl ester carboxylesterase